MGVKHWVRAMGNGVSFGAKRGSRLPLAICEVRVEARDTGYLLTITSFFSFPHFLLPTIIFFLLLLF